MSGEGGVVDLLGLGVDFNIQTSHPKALTTHPCLPPDSYAVEAFSQCNNVSMAESGEVVERVHPSRQGNFRASHDEQARLEAILDSDTAPITPRPINQHCRRHSWQREYTPSRYTAPRNNYYHDRDRSSRAHSDSYRLQREAWLETRRLRPEATFVSNMADLDTRDERYDRRDRGGYRGGNKRRRDGEFVICSAQVLSRVGERGAQSMASRNAAS